MGMPVLLEGLPVLLEGAMVGMPVLLEGVIVGLGMPGYLRVLWWVCLVSVELCPDPPTSTSEVSTG